MSKRDVFKEFNKFIDPLKYKAELMLEKFTSEGRTELPMVSGIAKYAEESNRAFYLKRTLLWRYKWRRNI